MDCCICSPMASMYRPPRNTICFSCYDGAKAMISFLSDGGDERGEDGRVPAKPHAMAKPNSSTKGIRDALKQVKEMRDREEEAKERAGFLESFAMALKDGIHTDIVVRPGSGAPIPAHRALLAARSEVFRNMLSADECKAPAGDSIALPELTHDELAGLLGFLYTGRLADDTTERHLHALLVAADKYDIPFLRRSCEAAVLRTLQPKNALRVLEVAELCSSAVLKERAMDAAVEHAEEVVFSREYEEFAARNASLCVEIARLLLVKMRDGRFDRSEG